ncbi:hypothetical protein A2U01_0116520, partial [Trifolium medium]|nr:hypothetical protein [Trifolium medium]
MVYSTLRPETIMYPRCKSVVPCCRSNATRNRMAIKLVDGYSTNHAE